MRYPKKHKAETRRRIVAAAGKLFRQKGYSACGIDAIMEEAQLTAGAFYRHFPSKEALLREVLLSSFETPASGREKGLEGLKGREWVEGLVHNYLSEGHLQELEGGCPLPALVPELTRMNKECRGTLENSLKTWQQQLTRQLRFLPEEEREQRAMGLIAALVGGMALARGLEGAQAVQMLEGAKAAALSSLGSSTALENPSSGFDRTS